MKVLLIGAAGMIGRKFVQSLLDNPVPGLSGLMLADAVPGPDYPDANIPITSHTFNIADEGVFEPLIAERPDAVVHLAAIVSGEAETDFDKGYAVNFDATRNLFDAIRLQEGYTPRVVSASSIAVFGAPFPDTIPGDFHLTPLTSYGTQKAMGELLLCDYTRRGFMDGVALRLPTICIRPGKANLAASSFFSNILREPLAGQEAVLPVDDSVRHWHASPRSAVGFLRHALTMDTTPIGPRRALTMPGLSATVAEQIEALREVAGDRAVALIRREPDPFIEKIVSGWATRFDDSRARSLGFTSDASFREIIENHLEDEGLELV